MKKFSVRTGKLVKYLCRLLKGCSMIVFARNELVFNTIYAEYKLLIERKGGNKFIYCASTPSETFVCNFYII